MRSKGPIVGADTETFDGYVKLLGFSDGTTYEPPWDRAGEATQAPSGCYTDDLLDLLYAKATEARWVVFWNLGFDFAAIFKPWIVLHADEYRATHYKNIQRRRRLAELHQKEEADTTLTPEELREVQELSTALDGEDNVERFDTGRYHVALIGSKGFSLSPKTAAGKRDHHKGREWFFDTSPWFSTSYGGVALDVASRKYLGEGKNAEELSIDRARIGSEPGYYEAHRAAITTYCLKDTDLTARLMERTVLGFERLGYPFPERPFSRASVSREYLTQTHALDATAARYERLKLSSYSDLWVKGFRGGVFLLMGAGVWRQPFAIDLNSAYPAAMVEFVSLEGAFDVPMSDPRFAACRFKFYRIRLCPTPRTPTRDRGETRKIYGWSDEETSLCVTGLDLEVLQEMGESFVIEEGVGIVTPSTSRPLAYLAEVFGRKSAVKKEYGEDSVEYANLKILLNGTYGILAQRRPRESRWTNLIYASYVTAWCRRALWRAVRETEERGGYVVSLATDGLLVAGEGPRSFWREQDSADLGAWSYSAHQEAVCFESGVGFLDERKVKKRGLPNLTREAMLACDGISWTETTSRPLKLRSALIQKRTEALGVFEEHERTLCPMDSYAAAGYSVPRDLVKAPLKSYFVRSWHLRLRGQVGDRLTPPKKVHERALWEAMRHRSRPEKGYMTPLDPKGRQARPRAKSAQGPTDGEEPLSAGETHEVPPRSGGEREARKAGTGPKMRRSPRVTRPERDPTPSETVSK